MNDCPECYGTMFPDLSNLAYNKENKGKAFSVLIKSAGIGVQSKNVSVNKVEWQKCQKCSCYRSCFDLCMAKKALQ